MKRNSYSWKLYLTRHVLAALWFMLQLNINFCPVLSHVLDTRI